MEEKKRNVPKLRFPGFTDEWEQRKLPEFVDFFSGLTYTPDDVREEGTLVLRSSNVKNGEVVNADNVYVNSEIAKSENVQVGDIIVVVRNGSRALIGKHAEIKESMPNTVIGAFMSGLRSENPAFINALLDTSRFTKEVEKNMGATINQITGYMFAQMEFRIPSDAEQKKIGTLFRNIEKTITLHQRKLDSIKEYKNGLLQKMFPKDGEKVPEIRFPGFTSDWEQRKLGEITSVAPFKPYLKDAAEQGNYNVIQQGDNPVLGYADGEPFIDFGKVTLFGDHTLSLYKPNSPFFVATDGLKILYSDGMESTFYYYLLEKYRPVSEGYKRHFSILKECECCFPKNISEQHKIGELFSNLDNTITLHQRKLELMKEYKKGLLQQMFV